MSHKILHILDHSLPLHSGYAFRSSSIFNAQAKRGWKPIGLTSPKHQVFLKADSADAAEEVEGFLYYRTGCGWPSRLTGLRELLLMAKLARRIQEIAAAEKPDILHAHSPVLNALPALRAGRKLGIPVVYEIRAFWEDAAVDHGTSSERSWRYRLTRMLETRACHQAEQVTVLCDGIRRDLIKRGVQENKLTIIFNGVDENRFSVSEPDPELARRLNSPGKHILGFFGSFYRYEGLDLLVSAFADVAHERSDVLLLLAGGGEMEEKLRSLIKRLHLDSRVFLAGRIPQERIPAAYALADIMVYPRYSMRLTELVTPLKPLEAMAMGKALVASDVGGHRELIKDGNTGLLFPAANREALRDALIRLLDRPELRMSLGAAARDWVRNFHTWDKTTLPYSGVYARAGPDCSFLSSSAHANGCK